ncbi:sugar transferase [Dictyobacter formicarum]|uniref:Bacterial sugar transferase domain-containing protein n=1 Tax=Dictyobacter formicarum TaxID=2778368 RepID=A0ABQ3VA43_9CHLR|nr:sugar transferase [Dictyobacter formicarum]GHO82747.1 hypothetical protein KSZ_07530 [Dictyobacter formicarum]
MKPRMQQIVSVDDPVDVGNARYETPEMHQCEKTFFSSCYPCWSLALNLTFGFSVSIILLLVLPVLALLIFLDSRGPIFYTQERLGYRGSTFHMYKFRTMHIETGQTKQLTWTTPNDPRITRVGRLLRATHLDELPQAFNILLGNMSLIGPRPEVPAFATKLEQTLPEYRSRLNVKPGLTGWAQIMYHYGDTLQDEQIKLHYDLYYIAHQSCRLDVQILFKTVGEVLSGHGR